MGSKTTTTTTTTILEPPNEYECIEDCIRTRKIITVLYECVLCFNLSLSLSLFLMTSEAIPKNMKIKMTSKCEGCARLFLYNLNMMSVIYSFNCEQNNTHIHMNGFPKIEVPKALPHTSQERKIFKFDD